MAATVLLLGSKSKFSGVPIAGGDLLFFFFWVGVGTMPSKCPRAPLALLLRLSKQDDFQAACYGHPEIFLHQLSFAVHASAEMADVKVVTGSHTEISTS